MLKILIAVIRLFIFVSSATVDLGFGKNIFFPLKLFPKEYSDNPFGVPQVSCLHVCIVYKMFQECNHRKVKLWLIKSSLRYVKTSDHRSDDRWLKCCLNDILVKTLPPYFKTADSLNIHIDHHEIHLSVTPFGTSISKSKITTLPSLSDIRVLHTWFLLKYLFWWKGKE